MPIPSMPGSRRTRRQRPNTVPKPVTSYKTATLVDDDTSLSKSNRYVSGSSWNVDYYNQILAANDTITLLDVGSSGDLQQYNRISNMEIKVTTALDVSLADQAEGQATVVNSIRPQEGDLFKATVAGNREALLVVTNVEQENYNNNPLFKITYGIDSLLDQDDVRFINLENKVVKKYSYDDSYTITESSPILLESSYAFKKRLEKSIIELTHIYLRSCVSNKLKLLTIPNQTLEIGDPYLEDYIFKIINYSTSNVLSNVNRISSGVELLSIDNIWIALLNKDLSALPLVKKNFALISTYGINIASPLSKTMINNEHNPLRLSNVPSGTLPEFPEDDYTYLFTSIFYDNPHDETLSDLEVLVYQMLSGNVLDSTKMETLLDTHKYWAPVEVFYYTPVLMLLIKDYIRTKKDIL